MRNLVRGKRTAFRRTTKRIVRLIRRTAERATRGQARRSDTDAVSAYWSRHTYPPNWYAFPMTAAYINESITGQNELPITTALIHEIFAELPIPRVLGICCGNGHAEVGFVRQGLWGEVDAYDIADGAVAEGAHVAAEANLSDVARFAVMDFNRPELPARTFSLAYCNGALHHLHGLEAALAAVYQSLTPGGCLLASEFTGPTRYQYGEEDVRLINEARAMLPPELGSAVPWSPRELEPKLRADPSEAARSEEVEAVLRATFDEVDARYFGGNVLMRALGKPFFAGFDETNPAHVEAVTRMIEFERELLASGRPSHHAYFIARKRAGTT